MELLAFGDRDPMVLECGDVLAESPPRIARGAEDQFTLFFGEVGTAADGDGGEEQREAAEARR
jgi:hypothetical protein